MGTITDISSEVNNLKKTYTFHIKDYKQSFKYSIYEDDEKKALNSGDNILAIVTRKDIYYSVQNLEHAL